MNHLEALVLVVLNFPISSLLFAGLFSAVGFVVGWIVCQLYWVRPR